MKIAICDDEEKTRNEVKKYITEYVSKHHLALPEIYLFSSGERLMASEEIFDIAFLDVEMEGISGIHAGRFLAQKNKKIPLQWRVLTDTTLIMVMITSNGTNPNHVPPDRMQ